MSDMLIAAFVEIEQIQQSIPDAFVRPGLYELNVKNFGRRAVSNHLLQLDTNLGFLLSHFVRTASFSLHIYDICFCMNYRTACLIQHECVDVF